MSSNAETVWFVTGTSRGIGLEMVKQLLQSPATIVLSACRSPSTADALQALIASAGGRLHILRLDVNDVQSVNDAAREAARIVGEKGIDYLINNAGINPGGDDRAFSLQMADLKAVFATNLVGPACVAQAFVSLVALSGRKSIVNVSSTLGSIGSADDREFGARFTSYAVVKAALNMLTCNVVTICPGHLQTDMGGVDTDTLPVSVGVSGVIKVMSSLTPKDSGTYLNYKGERLPW